MLSVPRTTEPPQPPPSVVQALRRVLEQRRTKTIDIEPSELASLAETDAAINRSRDFTNGRLRPMTAEEANRELAVRVPPPLYYSLDVGYGRIDGSPVRCCRVVIWGMAPDYVTYARVACKHTRAAVEEAMGALARWIAERENGKAA